MPRPDIEIRGLRELRRKLEQFEDGIDNLKATHTEAARKVQTTAERLVPRRSGTLADTVRSSGTKTGARVKAGFARVPYAGVIHFGGYNNIRPNPFLYDALDQRRAEVIDTYEQRIQALMRRYNL